MYGKLFVSIYDGTLAEDWRALVTFQQMIILCDQDGILDMTPSAIQKRTGIPIEHIKAGIEILESPDPYSRTPKEDGRRIIRLSDDRPWGWHIVNHKHYKDLRTAEDRREYMRRYMRDKRAEEKLTKTNKSKQKLHVSSLADTDTDTDTDIKTSHISKRNVTPYQDIISLYHETLPELPKVEKLTETRKGYLRQRWAQDLTDLDQWKNYFNHVRQSDFLMGKSSSPNRSPFRATLEWLTKPGNFAKVAEENYHG